MDCEEVRDLLSPYLDRELTGDEMTSIARHLENCPDCMNKSTIFSQLSRIIQHWEGIKASEDAKAALARKIRDASSGTERRRPFPVAVLLLLAGALFIGGGAALLVWMMQGRSGGEYPAAVSCERVAGRVEIIDAGGNGNLEAKAGRRLSAGQKLRCRLGSAVQLVLPGAGRTRFVLRGPGTLEIGKDSVRLEAGRLTFHYRELPADAVRAVIRAGSFSVRPRGLTVGLTSISGDGTVRLAVKEGEARLLSSSGTGGISVKAGYEISIRPGGGLSAPVKISAGEEFGLLGSPVSAGAD